MVEPFLTSSVGNSCRIAALRWETFSLPSIALFSTPPKITWFKCKRSKHGIRLRMKDDRALGKNRREGWETMTGSWKGAGTVWAGGWEEQKSEVPGQRGWEMMMARGKNNVWKGYKGKQMEIIWWETEGQSWAWLAEESVGQGCVRKQ